MSETEREGRSSRRDFLKVASVGATAAGVAAVSAGTAAAAESPASEDGYRRTEHVAKYLDSCRF